MIIEFRSQHSQNFHKLDERSQILIRVTDQDGEEVDRFTMGTRIFYNEEQIVTWRPESHDMADTWKKIFSLKIQEITYFG